MSEQIEGTNKLLQIAASVVLMCLECVAQHKKSDQENTPEADLPPINPAITLCPSWQSQIVNGQALMACVSVPTCYDHISVGDQSPQQRAMRSGLMLPGNGMG